MLEQKCILIRKYLISILTLKQKNILISAFSLTKKNSVKINTFYYFEI